jgi:SAM-dependent methyltransferase
MESTPYIGGELELFQHAVNWKAYFRSQISRHIHGDVLEVGAGLGGTTALLAHASCKSWLCLEPDGALLEKISLIENQLPLRPQKVVGNVGSLPADARFDSILYIDVLEHIEDDAGEVTRAAGRLRQGGELVILCPAHQFLFTEFDRTIHHFRRYNKAMFRALTCPGLTLDRLFYLDSVGVLASMSNVLLKQSLPRLWQIKMWDRCMIPCSRVIDPLIFRCAGKAVVGVWRKN